MSDCKRNAQGNSTEEKTRSSSPSFITRGQLRLSSRLDRVTNDHEMKMQLYGQLKPVVVREQKTHTQTRHRLHDVSLWVKNSKLKLNADKTEFRIIGISKQRAKLDGFPPTHILSQNITPAASVLNLGVTFDENFNFKQHISETYRCRFTISVIFAVFAG